MLVKTKPRKEAKVQDMREACRRAALCKETPDYFTASPGYFFVEILGHNSAFWSNKNLWDQAKHPIPDEQNYSELCAKNTAPVSSTSSSSREVFPTLKHHQHAEDKGHMCQQCFWNRYHGTTALSKSNLPRICSWLTNIVFCVPAEEVTRQEGEHPRSLETVLCQTLRHFPCSE